MAGLMTGSLMRPKPIADPYYKPAEDTPKTAYEDVPTFDASQWGPNSVNGRIGGGQGSVPTATTRQVQANELSGNQLTDLTSSNSRYIQNARAQGAETAAARGSMAGNYYAGASENAAIGAAAPFALQQAAAYGDAAAQNQQARNAASIAGASNQTQASIATMQARAQSYDALLRANVEREQNALNRNLTRDEQAQQERLTRAQIASQEGIAREGFGVQREGFANQRAMQQDQQNFTRGENALDRTQQNRLAQQNFRWQVAGAAIGTVLGNPEYMRDPAGAAGMVRFWQDFVNDPNVFPDIGG